MSHATSNATAGSQDQPPQDDSLTDFGGTEGDSRYDDTEHPPSYDQSQEQYSDRAQGREPPDDIVSLSAIPTRSIVGHHGTLLSLTGRHFWFLLLHLCFSPVFLPI